MLDIQPKFSPYKDDKVILNDPWNIEYYSDVLGWVWLGIKRGFVLDGESSPWFVWGLWGHPLEAGNAPQATGHDGLYKAMLCTRKEADQIWLDIATINGVGWIERHVKHKCLRVGGWKAWNSNQDKADYWRLFVKLEINGKLRKGKGNEL